MSRLDLSHPLAAGAAAFAAALVCTNMTWLMTVMFGLMSGFVGPQRVYQLWIAEVAVWLSLAPILYARIVRDARVAAAVHAGH